jgi:hypothetical protein
VCLHTRHCVLRKEWWTKADRVLHTHKAYNVRKEVDINPIIHTSKCVKLQLWVRVAQTRTNATGEMFDLTRGLREDFLEVSCPSWNLKNESEKPGKKREGGGLKAENPPLQGAWQRGKEKKRGKRAEVRVL